MRRTTGRIRSVPSWYLPNRGDKLHDALPGLIALGPFERLGADRALDTV